ncbi:hypothetical protein [Saccharothrix coeruleofusca]|uniref:hypothetical protein n=1 Tax=Saccharothrix coeruleofusca TaxID=33919 RepID=UPI00166F8B4D|nr:hypothetical protein [Saccharothrix coeruleofusca]
MERGERAVEAPCGKVVALDRPVHGGLFHVGDVEVPVGQQQVAVGGQGREIDGGDEGVDRVRGVDREQQRPTTGPSPCRASVALGRAAASQRSTSSAAIPCSTASSRNWLNRACSSSITTSTAEEEHGTTRPLGFSRSAGEW